MLAVLTTGCSPMLAWRLKGRQGQPNDWMTTNKVAGWLRRPADWQHHYLLDHTPVQSPCIAAALIMPKGLLKKTETAHITRSQRTHLHLAFSKLIYMTAITVANKQNIWDIMLSAGACCGWCWADITIISTGKSISNADSCLLHGVLNVGHRAVAESSELCYWP